MESWNEGKAKFRGGEHRGKMEEEGEDRGDKLWDG